MAVRKRGSRWHIRFWMDKREIWAITEARGKREAQAVEQAVKRAIRTGDYYGLDSISRQACIRIFRNQGWEMPEALVATGRQKSLTPEVNEKLTLLKGAELCLKYPDVRGSKDVDRKAQCFLHLIRLLGTDRPIKEIKIPLIKEYRTTRLEEGAAPATINREKSTLSKMFQVLIEMELVENNPCRSIKSLRENSDRPVYLSHEHWLIIESLLPPWLKPVAQTAYYTGMRRGEIVGLTNDEVNLDERMIVLGSDRTKEGHLKRVPIHRDLVPKLADAMKVRSFEYPNIFLKNGRPFSKGMGRRSWQEAFQKAGLPPMTFHSLRHTWKKNACNSGIDEGIQMAIMGHAGRQKSTPERYRYISDDDLRRAIDKITFDNGETKTWSTWHK